MSSDPSSADQCLNQSVGCSVQESWGYDQLLDKSCVTLCDGQQLYSVGNHLVLSDSEQQSKLFLQKVPFSFVSGGRLYTLPVNSRHDNVAPLESSPASMALTTTAIAAHSRLPFVAVAETSAHHDFLRVCIFYLKSMPSHNAEQVDFLVAVVYLPLRKPVEGGRQCSLMTHLRFTPTGLLCVGDRACTPVWSVHLIEHALVGLQTSIQPNDGTDLWQWFHGRWTAGQVDQLLVLQTNKFRQQPALCTTVDVVEVVDSTHGMLVPNQSWIAAMTTDDGDVQLLIQHSLDVTIMFGSIVQNIRKTDISPLQSKKTAAEMRASILKEMEIQRTETRDEVLASKMSQLPYKLGKSEPPVLCQNGFESKTGNEGVLSEAPSAGFIGAFWMKDSESTTTYFQLSVLMSSLQLVTTSSCMLVRQSKAAGNQALLTPLFIAEVPLHVLSAAATGADRFHLVGCVDDELRVLEVGKNVRSLTRVQEILPVSRPTPPKLMVQGIEVVLDDLDEPEPATRAATSATRTGWIAVECFMAVHPLAPQVASDELGQPGTGLGDALWQRCSCSVTARQFTLAGPCLLSMTLASKPHVSQNTDTVLRAALVAVCAGAYHRQDLSCWAQQDGFLAWVHVRFRCLLVFTTTSRSLVAAILLPQQPSSILLDGSQVFCVIKGQVLVYQLTSQTRDPTSLPIVLTKCAEITTDTAISSLCIIGEELCIATQQSLIIIHKRTLTRKKLIPVTFDVMQVLHLPHMNSLLVAGQREILTLELPSYTLSGLQMKSGLYDIRTVSSSSAGLFINVEREYKGDLALCTLFYPFRKSTQSPLNTSLFDTCCEVLDCISVPRDQIPLVHSIDELLPVGMINMLEPGLCSKNLDDDDGVSFLYIHPTETTVTAHVVEPGSQSDVQVLICQGTPLLVSALSRQQLCVCPQLALLAAFTGPGPHVPCHDVYYPRPLPLETVRDLLVLKQPLYTPFTHFYTFQFGLLELIAVGTHTGVLMICLPMARHQYQPNSTPERRDMPFEQQINHMIPHLYVLSSTVLSTVAISSISFAPKLDPAAEPLLLVALLDGQQLTIKQEVQPGQKTTVTPQLILKQTTVLQEQHAKPQLSSVQRYLISVAAQDPNSAYAHKHNEASTPYCWVNPSVQRSLQCSLVLPPRMCVAFYPLIKKQQRMNVDFPLLNETKSIVSMNVFSVLQFLALVGFPDQYLRSATLPSVCMINGQARSHSFAQKDLIPLPFTHFYDDLQHILAVYLKNVINDVNVIYFDGNKGGSLDEAARSITELASHHSKLQEEKQSQVDSAVFMLRYEREQKDTLVAQKTEEFRKQMVEAQDKQRKAEEHAAQMRVDYDKWILEFNEKRVSERKQLLYLFEERLAKESARVRVLSETLESTMLGIQQSFGEAETEWHQKEAELLQTIKTQKESMDQQHAISKAELDKEMHGMVDVLMNEFDEMHGELTSAIERGEVLETNLQLTKTDQEKLTKLETKRGKMQGDEQFSLKKSMQALNTQQLQKDVEKTSIERNQEKETTAHQHTKSLLGVVDHSLTKEREQRRETMVELKKTQAELLESFSIANSLRQVDVQSEVRKVVEEDDEVIMGQQKQLVQQNAALRSAEAKQVHLQGVIKRQRDDSLVRRKGPPRVPLSSLEDAVAAAGSYGGDEETTQQLLAFIQEQSHVIDHFRNQVLKQKHTNNLDRSQRLLMASRAAEELRAAREQLIIARKDKKALENQYLQLKGQSSKTGAVSRIDIMVGKEASSGGTRPQSAIDTRTKKSMKPQLPVEALGRVVTSSNSRRAMTGNSTPLEQMGGSKKQILNNDDPSAIIHSVNDLDDAPDWNNIVFNIQQQEQQQEQLRAVEKPRSRPGTAQIHRVKPQKAERALQQLQQQKLARMKEAKDQGIAAARLALDASLHATAKGQLGGHFPTDTHRMRADAILRLNEQIQPATNSPSNDSYHDSFYVHSMHNAARQALFSAQKEIGSELEGGGAVEEE